jgi:hypothetical protein
MKSGEKMIGLIVGVAAVWLGGIFFLVMPRWKELSASWDSVKALKSEQETLKAQETSLTQKISAYGAREFIPKGIQLRPYSLDSFDKSLKIVLDTLVEIALEQGNLFISLEPDKEGDSTPSVEPSSQNTATPAAPATAEAPNSPPPAPPPIQAQLKSFGYKMSVRGSYDEVIGFLNALSKLREVMAVRQIVLINEAAPAATGAASSDAFVNPLKPLRLDTFIQIYMVENAENIPAEFMVPPTAEVSRQPLEISKELSQILVSP